MRIELIVLAVSLAFASAAEARGAHGGGGHRGGGGHGGSFAYGAVAGAAIGVPLYYGYQRSYAPAYYPPTYYPPAPGYYGNYAPQGNYYPPQAVCPAWHWENRYGRSVQVPDC